MEQFVREHTDDGRFVLEQAPDGGWFTVIQVMGGTYFFDADTRDDLIAKCAEFRKIKYQPPRLPDGTYDVKLPLT